MSDKTIAKQCNGYFYDITDEVLDKFSVSRTGRVRGINTDVVHFDEVNFITGKDNEE